ncbi:hypothetical protein D8Y22_22220 [Salinadaptatus halalkaliphilus]|uniref:PD-(D/E)XK endonuclease-like domain-containing protein n=1 Tax=Salinadaptatus halalkaliphilus TaxID=2419781 RepID=A0A4S3TG30_9EURY|nr:PD-(D/E)XK nuclease family protein [Salinadaptatus halalkaliphilus]THE62782.1 hypothetical protein D8Y22_22220 [Salinadaptatus halalkaliphilus]
MSNGGSNSSQQAATHLSIDGLETYLECPRRYEFAYVHELAGDAADDRVRERVALCRQAICAALGSAESEPDAIAAVALERLDSLWAEYDERFHSLAQRRHERAVLEATIREYVETVGTAHAKQCGRLAGETGGELIGPTIPLARSVGVSPPAGPTDGEPALEIEAPVDYVYGDDDTIVGVRFVPTCRSLGLLRYRSSWTGDVSALFANHFDPARDVFEPGPVAALFETSVVLEGLRNLCDRLELDRRCRYVQIPLAERSSTSVNWVRGTVEAAIEPTELTDVYVDDITYGMTHEHRNETVDDRLESVVDRLASGAFDPTDRWERIRRNACPDCPYTVGCEEYVAAEVEFDG